jgi:AcrR family transcriptional regulator
VRLVNERGFGALSFRTLAEDLGVTRTAPLYYFGSMAGLAAALAAYGFRELTSQLHDVRESGKPPEAVLKDLALAYAKYALRYPHLYRAMHAPELWHAATGLERAGNSRKHGEAWIKEAAHWRMAAFEEFELAVGKAVEAERVAKERTPHGEASARLLTAIVDGFLFHHFMEDEGVGMTTRRLLTNLEELLDRALTGLLLTPR